jgi:hypothetical protein
VYQHQKRRQQDKSQQDRKSEDTRTPTPTLQNHSPHQESLGAKGGENSQRVKNPTPTLQNHSPHQESLGAKGGENSQRVKYPTPTLQNHPPHQESLGTKGVENSQRVKNPTPTQQNHPPHQESLSAKGVENRLRVKDRQQEGAGETGKLMHYKEYISLLERRAKNQDQEYRKKTANKYRKILFDTGATSTFICEKDRENVEWEGANTRTLNVRTANGNLLTTSNKGNLTLHVTQKDFIHTKKHQQRAQSQRV